ncbi:MAG: hypothetical protein GC131_00855 [Alphaproteobacteria bacterium]|nr:hypothetical protein [Alphaproteobacteria bacterium]
MHIAWLNETPFTKDPAGTLTSNLASARYRCLIPARELKPLGVECSIFGNLGDVNIDELKGYWQKLGTRIAVVGKFFSPKMIEIAAASKATGHTLIADYCDNHFNRADTGPLHTQLAAIADIVVASTPMMADIIKQATGRDAIVVPDPFEGPGGEARFAPAAEGPLKLLWFGHQSNLDTLVPVLGGLAALAQQNKISLTIMTGPHPALNDFLRAQTENFRITLAQWSMDGLWHALAACDMAIIPSLENEKKTVKGANRLIEALWAGRAVVAYPLPSYKEFDEYCRLTFDIAQGIAAAQQDSASTLQQVKAGRQYIEMHYAPAVIAGKWRAVFSEAVRAAA